MKKRLALIAAAVVGAVALVAIPSPSGAAKKATDGDVTTEAKPGKPGKPPSIPPGPPPNKGKPSKK